MWSFETAAETWLNHECKADTRTLKSPLFGLRFHDLRHHAITELAESHASERTIMAIAGHVSPKMLDHYSHVRMQAKRQALDSLSEKASVTSKEAQSAMGYGTKNVTNSKPERVPFSQVIEKNGGDDETRTRDLCRDRREVNHWHKQNQQVRRAVVGNRWLYRDSSAHFVQRFVQRPL
jgi:hypothetical protein